MIELPLPKQEQLAKQLLAIRSWFTTGKGQKLLALEKPMVNEALSYYFGRFLLQVGPLAELPSSIKDVEQIITLGCLGFDVDIVNEEYAWPIITESVDAVVLQHALDFAHSPHDLLREAARCIRPGGHLLVIGFNPFSFWGIYRRCYFGILGKSHSIGCGRLLDWLRLLGFAVEKHWTGGYCLPIVDDSQERLTVLESIGQRRGLWGNGFYIVSARKLMIQSTPLESNRKLSLAGLTPIPMINRGGVKSNEQDC